MTRIVPVLVFAATLLIPAGQILLAQTAPAQIVKDRQDAMDKMWPDFYRDIGANDTLQQPRFAIVAAKALRRAST